MALWRVCLLALMVVTSGCSMLGGGKVPEGAMVGDGELDYWIVEGDIEYRGERGYGQDMNFSWTQSAQNYVFELRPGKERKLPHVRLERDGGEIFVDGAMIEGGPYVGPNVPMPKLRGHFPSDYMQSWLLGRKATNGARVVMGKKGQIDKLSEGGWDVEFKSYFITDNYRIPEKIIIEGFNTKYEIFVVRAETSFVAGCCEAQSAPNEVPELGPEQPLAAKSWATMTTAERKQNPTPVPLWVNEEEFERQLIKVHGEIPDPKNGLFGPGSMMWKLAGQNAPGGLGAGRALLLQTAHPWVTIGIDEHSYTRDDPLERGRRTFTNLFAMLYGSLPQAMAAAERVRRAHDPIQGQMKYEAGAFKKGSQYAANEINAMIWVHATLWETTVHMHEELYGKLSDGEKERFYQETKLFAMLFGIPESALPKNWDDFMKYNQDMWNSEQLVVTPATRELAHYLFKPKSIFLWIPMEIQKIFTAANLPPRLRDEYGLKYGWFQKTGYKTMTLGARLVTPFLPGTIRYNPSYHEAMARLEGKRAGWIPRTALKLVMGKERIAN